MQTCSMPGCYLKHYAKDYCIKHYHRNRRHGDPTIVLYPRVPGRSIRRTNRPRTNGPRTTANTKALQSSPSTDKLVDNTRRYDNQTKGQV